MSLAHWKSDSEAGRAGGCCLFWIIFSIIQIEFVGLIGGIGGQHILLFFSSSYSKLQFRAMQEFWMSISVLHFLLNEMYFELYPRNWYRAFEPISLWWITISHKIYWCIKFIFGMCEVLWEIRPFWSAIKNIFAGWQILFWYSLGRKKAVI